MSGSSPSLPRVAITFCTQCKWMLRAAYFGQELLSTFGTAIGEIALIPATGGLFKVELSYQPELAASETTGKEVEIQHVLLWDRKAEGGFPETKVLKQRVRDHIQPSKDLGHSDTHGNGSVKASNAAPTGAEATPKSVAKSSDSESALDSSTKALDALSISDSSTVVGDTWNNDDTSAKAGEAADREVKRNADGSICEDCR